MGGLKGRIALGVALLVVAAWALGRVARDPVTAFAAPLMRSLGLPGLFWATLLTDPVPGVGFQPSIFFGYTGGIHPAALLAVTSAASLVASGIVYVAGRSLRGWAWLDAQLARRGIGEMLATRGGFVLVIAAVGPLPWGLCALGAGAAGVPLGTFAVAAASRVAKIAMVLGAVAAGWG